MSEKFIWSETSATKTTKTTSKTSTESWRLLIEWIFTARNKRSRRNFRFKNWISEFIKSLKIIWLINSSSVIKRINRIISTPWIWALKSRVSSISKYSTVRTNIFLLSKWIIEWQVIWWPIKWHWP